MTKRELKGLDAIIIFAIAFLLYQVAGAVLTLLMAKNDAYIFLAYSLPQIFYIATTFIYVKTQNIDFSILKKENVKGVHYAVATALGLGMFFFALLPNFGAQQLFALLGKNPSVTLPDFSKTVNIILGLFVICILPAIGEELVFRKVFVDGFSAYGAVVAIILSGVIFGLSHLNLAQTIHQIFLGCVLSFLYLRTKNITLTVLIHFLNNLLALYLPLISGETMWNNLTVLIISCIIGLAIMVSSLLYILKKTSYISKSDMAKPSWYVVSFVAILAGLWVICVAVG